MGKAFEKVLLRHGWEKIPNWECLFVHREKGLFLSVYVDDKKELAGNKQNISPTWKILMKDVDLGEPTSYSLTMSIWVALKENVKQAKILWTTTVICLNPKSLLELQKKLPDSEKLGANISSWS